MVPVSPATYVSGVRELPSFLCPLQSSEVAFVSHLTTDCKTTWLMWWLLALAAAHTSPHATCMASCRWKICSRTRSLRVLHRLALRRPGERQQLSLDQASSPRGDYAALCHTCRWTSPCTATAGRVCWLRKLIFGQSCAQLEALRLHTAARYVLTGGQCPGAPSTPPPHLR